MRADVIFARVAGGVGVREFCDFGRLCRREDHAARAAYGQGLALDNPTSF